MLLSAGIGATPVMAMLYALAAARTARPVVWLHAARDGQHHPFAAEVRRLMGGLTHGRRWVCYSAPDPADTMPGDYDVSGHLSRAVLERIGIPRDADVYLCGPARFMAEMKEVLAGLGVAPERMHAELFNGNESLTPGVVGCHDARAPSARARRRHRPAGVVRAERRRGPLEPVGLSERAGAGRGVRRSGALVVPDRRVPQLRERPRVGRSRLRAGAARSTGGGQPAGLLRAACGRRRHRSVTSLGGPRPGIPVIAHRAAGECSLPWGVAAARRLFVLPVADLAPL